MKIIVESLENGDAKLTLEFQNKSYSETWRNTGSVYKTIDGSIINKMEKDGITSEDTDIEEYLTSIDMYDFMNLAESEEDW
jgi:hypothetical protein